MSQTVNTLNGVGWVGSARDRLEGCTGWAKIKDEENLDFVIYQCQISSNFE